MFSKPDFSTLRRSAHVYLLGGGAGLAATLLAGCSWLPFDKSAEEAASRTEAQSAAAADRAAAAAANTSAPAPNISLATPAPAASDALPRMLSYSERVRQMPGAELGQEAARLSADQSSAANQMQLALVLSQSRQLQELIRAQELLARVLGNSDEQAQPLHPLARLLAARFGEQRRVEEQLEKEKLQARELQRKLDQTNERLEALKAIERSLTSRPAASAPTPDNQRKTAPAP
jgi:hypothetical protein